MSFPVIMWGEEGEQFNQYTDKRYALGQQMVFMDGRKFRFCLNGAATLVSGTVVQAAANVAGNVNQAVQAAVAASSTSTSIPITVGATTITANQYADGYCHIDVTPGQGFVYKIAKSHVQAANATTFLVPLAPGYSVQVALTTSSKASLIQNPYANVIASPVTTLTGAAIGVAQCPIINAQYGWIQTRGQCNVLGDGTFVLGDSVCQDLATASNIQPYSTVAAVSVIPVIGVVQRVGASAAQTIIDLRIDG